MVLIFTVYALPEPVNEAIVPTADPVVVKIKSSEETLRATSLKTTSKLTAVDTATGFPTKFIDCTIGGAAAVTSSQCSKLSKAI